MDMNAPPKPLIRPENIMAMYLIFSTDTPTEAAALLFSPTAQIFRPSGVLYSMIEVSRQNRNAR